MRIRVSPIHSISEVELTSRPHACFDNAAACRTLLEFWKHNDKDGQEDALPRDVFSKLKSRPFLD
jgi:hypothetical protein